MAPLVLIFRVYRQSKTLKEKITQELKASKAVTNGNMSRKESGKSAEADALKNTLSTSKIISVIVVLNLSLAPNSNVDLTYGGFDKLKAEDAKNLSRLPMPLDLPNLSEKPLPGLSNLMGPDLLDMRSPGLNYLNEHFMKPSSVAQRLNQQRDDFGAPLHMNPNYLLNEGHDGFSNQLNRKGSYENYLQYLDDANNIWRKMDAASGFKMMPPYLPMMAAPGIGSFMGFGGGYPQRDLSFMLDDSFMGSMGYDQNHADFGDHNGIEPSKRVKKE